MKVSKFVHILKNSCAHKQKQMLLSTTFGSRDRNSPDRRSVDHMTLTYKFKDYKISDSGQYDDLYLWIARPKQLPSENTNQLSMTFLKKLWIILYNQFFLFPLVIPEVWWAFWSTAKSECATFPCGYLGIPLKAQYRGLLI